MTQRLDTTTTADGRTYGSKHNILATARWSSMSHQYVLEWTNDVLGWGPKHFQSLETCDWTALAYASEMTATGY